MMNYLAEMIYNSLAPGDPAGTDSDYRDWLPVVALNIHRPSGQSFVSALVHGKSPQIYMVGNMRTISSGCDEGQVSIGET